VDSLAGGEYNWRAKGPTYLAVTGTLTLTGGMLTQVEMDTQRPGDIDNNNLVSLTDFNILAGTYGRRSTDPGYDARADYDGNDTIGLGDFNLFRGSYGQAGGGPIRPGGP